jgi:RNA polymerase sigma-70 factor (ECF subfamily)
VLDAFCAAFNARDIDRLTALLLDTTVVELPGLVVEYGPAAAKAGTFRGTLFGCPDEEHAALPNVRAEVHLHRGEPILAWWADGEVHTVVRVVLEGDRIAHLKSYYHAPEVLAEVCRELELPYRTHGYRYWSEGAES